MARSNRKKTSVKKPDMKNELFTGEAMSTTPVLIHLVGPDFETYGSCSLQVKILEAIEYRIALCPRMQLRGRTEDLFRILFDPTCEKYFGIKSRMNKLLSDAIDYTALETLLSPLIATNLKAFPEINPETLMTRRRLRNGQYYNCLLYGMTNIRWIKPIIWENRAIMVTGVLDAVRRRCTKVYPDSSLLRDPQELNGMLRDDEKHHLQEWSLYGLEIGLAVKLRRCFEDADLSSEEYEDLLERELYLYKRANLKAMTGEPKHMDVVRTMGEIEEGNEEEGHETSGDDDIGSDVEGGVAVHSTEWPGADRDYDGGI